VEERFQGRLCEMAAEECALNRAWRLLTKVHFYPTYLGCT
jgi:hypothetical protein